MSLRRKIVAGITSFVTIALLFTILGLWTASDQVLQPSFLGLKKDLSFCPEEAAKVWGKDCGNLRQTKQYAFTEVSIPVHNYNVPGWFISTRTNGYGDARGAILMVHSGGSDRREDTKYLPMLLGQKLDILTFDLSCNGEAPCPGHGLTYGYRESQDIKAAYDYLHKNHQTVYVMGASMGATSVLVALPNLNNVAGIIVENPMYSFARLIKESPQSKSMPGWMSDGFIHFVQWRGGFDDSRTPVKTLGATKVQPPILFIHSKKDVIVPYKQTIDLANLYHGKTTVWLPEAGNHSEIWNTNRTEYEKRVTDFLKVIQ